MAMTNVMLLRIILKTLFILIPIMYAHASIMLFLCSVEGLSCYSYAVLRDCHAISMQCCYDAILASTVCKGIDRYIFVE